ncbi:hypothetical protein pb186bvf_020888 [Paramecium bursaria]
MQQNITIFPPKYLESYEEFEEVSKQLEPLKNLGQEYDPEGTFYLIRAPTRDNVHRAIKYGVWTSSSRNNQKLNEAKAPVYLLFNVIQQSSYIGVAKIKSQFQEKSHFKYWCEENKWFGSFSIEWVFVKDVSYNDIKGIHESIDCTQLKNGQEIYDTFKAAPQKSTIFRFFKDLDVSEQKKRKDRDNNPQFEIAFNEYISVFEQMPFNFSVASYQRKKQQQYEYMQYQYYYQQPWTVQQNQFYSYNKKYDTKYRRN